MFLAPPPAPPPAPPALAAACQAGPASAARLNAASLATMFWAPFGRPETGWATYAPMVAATLGTDCPPTSPGFAAAAARWQQGNRLSDTGVIDIPDLMAMKAVWQSARPLVVQSRAGCPAPARDLATATPAESYGGKTIRLAPGALAAWRRLRAAAFRDLPELKRDPRWLTVFSGFRDPAADAERCRRDGNCNGIVRATCSPHRTGLALDVYVGQAPGFGPDSSADANRLAMSRTAAYRWLVGNAHRFGFRPYVFEPWHWEWAGKATDSTPAEPSAKAGA